jgi:hypothetical protein
VIERKGLSESETETEPPGGRPGGFDFQSRTRVPGRPGGTSSKSDSGLSFPPSEARRVGGTIALS